MVANTGTLGRTTEPLFNINQILRTRHGSGSRKNRGLVSLVERLTHALSQKNRKRALDKISEACEKALSYMVYMPD